ncbi:MAG: hypothetical protein JXR03_13245 [Cyclobacteriaceae bacterium]
MKIKISYQTLILPPPFAFGYTLEFEIKETEMDVSFELEYLNRDTISEEEILTEGFTTNDDFKWSGSLGKAWCDEMANIKDIELSDVANHENVWMHFSIKSDKEEKSGLVQDVELWDFRIQELIQAIYEKAKYEFPLKVKLIDCLEGRNETYIISGQFETLSARINKNELSWREMQEMMSLVFSSEIIESAEKKPNEKGLWIDAESDGNFYKLDLKEADLKTIRSVLRPS